MEPQVAQLPTLSWLTKRKRKQKPPRPCPKTLAKNHPHPTTPLEKPLEKPPRSQPKNLPENTQKTRPNRSEPRQPPTVEWWQQFLASIFAEFHLFKATASEITSFKYVKALHGSVNGIRIYLVNFTN